MDNQHRKIKGYRELTEFEIDQINVIKEIAGKIGSVVEAIQERGDDCDQRAISLAKTNLQQGFMWLIRGIAQPEGF